jgi:hypothetical protein
MDKKEIALSTVAGLAVIVVGYLVWRHEQLISAAQAQSNLDAQQAQADQLQQEIAALPQAGYSAGGGGGFTDSTDTGSSSLQTPANTSGGLQDILNAFYPASTPVVAPPVSTVTPPTSTNAPSYTPPTPVQQLPTTDPSYVPPSNPPAQSFIDSIASGLLNPPPVIPVQSTPPAPSSTYDAGTGMTPVSNLGTDISGGSGGSASSPFASSSITDTGGYSLASPPPIYTRGPIANVGAS